MVLVLGGVAPTQAEELPVETVAPTDGAVGGDSAADGSSTAEPSDPPADPTTPPPTTEPVDPTTPPPTTDPVDPTTPPPTTPPPTTEPPVDPTTPPPTTEPTPPPPAEPAPTAPVVRAPLLIGDGPVLRFSTVVDTSVMDLLAARGAIDAATTTLRTAENELTAAKAAREVARSIAERFDDAAETAREKADEAAAVSFTAQRSADATGASALAAVGSGGDLLAGLGGMSRMSTLNGDPAKLLELAKHLDAEADDAEAAADDAWAEVDEVPVDDRDQDVRAAEAAVTQARAEMQGIQTKVAATSVALVDTLPADSGQLSDQGWSPPVTGRVTDGFGPRPDKPLPGVNEFHRGTDVAATCGTPVFAATDGVVVEARSNGGYGNWILLDHGSGVSTGYAHLVDGGILVSAGQFVTAGQLIGMVGSTGASTGCHLHFEVRIGGIAVDARPFMAARGIGLG